VGLRVEDGDLAVVAVVAASLRDEAVRRQPWKDVESVISPSNQRLNVWFAIKRLLTLILVLARLAFSFLPHLDGINAISGVEVDLETPIAYFGHGLNGVISTNGPGLADFHPQPCTLYDTARMQIVARRIQM
jgi:hypothetical protein